MKDVTQEFTTVKFKKIYREEENTNLESIFNRAVALDQFYNNAIVKRKHAIDHIALIVFTMNFVKNENNKGFKGFLSDVMTML